MLHPDTLDAIRERVAGAERLVSYPVDVELLIAQADRRILLGLVERQQKTLERAHEFTENYERQLLKGLTENTLQYFRNILSGRK